MNPELGFLGAAGTVTGSRRLLHVDGTHYLVDCGLFQGGQFRANLSACETCRKDKVRI